MKTPHPHQRIKRLSMSLPKNEGPGSSLAFHGPQTIKNSGNIIIQNWNTKVRIPKELEEYVNLPIIADKGKLGKSLSNAKMLPPIQGTSNVDKNYYSREP